MIKAKIVAKVKRGDVISHPLGERGMWLAKHVEPGGGANPGRITSLLIEKLGRGKYEIQHTFTLRSKVTALSISKKEVILYGKMEEVKSWKWKEKYFEKGKK